MLLAWLVACKTGPTYNVDVKPILDAHCTTCHVEGGVSPFALTDYAAASAVGTTLPGAIDGGLMPPWRADDACTAYEDDLVLPAADASVIADWVAAGMPEGKGDPGPVHVGATTLTRADVTAQVPEPWTPATDETRCFLLDYPGDDAYVTGFVAVPGAPQEVRHVSAFLVPPDQLADYQAADAADPDPGYACPGGPVGRPTDDATWLASWTPGEVSGDFPAGTGIPIAAGSAIGLQIDYHTNAPVPDQTTFSLMVDSGALTVARLEPYFDPTWPTTVVVPGGTEDARFDYAGTAPAGTLYAADLLIRGDGASVELDGPDGCLVDLAHWDPHWRRSYILATPLALSAGDPLTLSCHLRNRGTGDVAWGEGAGDAGCFAFLYLTP